MPCYGDQVPTPPSDKRMLNVRVPNDEFAEVERIARRENADRTKAVRLMLTYAARFMPKGWKP